MSNGVTVRRFERAGWVWYRTVAEDRLVICGADAAVIERVLRESGYVVEGQAPVAPAVTPEAPPAVPAEVTA
jgi:hypothetical protein